MRIVFMGTPDFAVPCLQYLIDRKYEVAAVVTQPDRPVGRHSKLVAPPVKTLAENSGIPVYQPEKVKTPEFVATLKALAPDLVIVVAFGQILSPELLAIPKLGCVNVHASLLPQYRGAAPINWCIINGEKKTGVTTMYMDKGLDTGDMILKSETPIGEDEIVESLYNRLCVMGAELLVKTVELIREGKAERTAQDHEKASYSPIMNKALGKIDWSKDAVSIYNLYRGTFPWPGIHSMYKGKAFKILNAAVLEKDRENKEWGVITEVLPHALVIACGKGFLKVTELQFENEKKMGVEAYLRGHNIEKGTVLS